MKRNCDYCSKEVTGKAYGVIDVEVTDSWCEVADEVNSFIHIECYEDLFVYEDEEYFTVPYPEGEYNVKSNG